MSEKSIIEKLGIPDGYHISDGDMAIWNDSDEMKTLKDSAPEMLEALIEVSKVYEFSIEHIERLDYNREKWDKKDEITVRLYKYISIIEKATGKSWAEIKELL